MRGKRRFILLLSLALVLLASSVGVTSSYLFDLESSTGNTFQAWTSRQWTQTTEGDFNAGVLNNVISVSPGDVQLESIAQEPTTSVGSEESWYAGWSYRKKITIDHTQVENVADPEIDYANFPILVYATGLSNILPNGADIRFTESDGITELPREIESYSSGTLYAWVSVDLTKDASDSTDDVIYMYYGNAAATEPAPGSTYGSQNVWDSNYMGVWHLSEDPSGAPPQMKDSTSNANDGTSQGSMTAGDQVTGQIDGSLDLDGIDDYIQTTSGESQTASNITWEVWFKADVTTGSHHILWQGPASQNGWGEPGQAATHEMHLTIGRMSTADRLVFFYGYEFSSGNFVPAVEIDIAFSDTTNWHYAVMVLTGADSSPSGTLYLDGSSVGTDTGTETDRTSWDTNLRIGQCGAAQRRLDGLADEVRVSNIDRSAEWIKTCYNNQNSPSSFCSVSPEESWHHASWSRRAPVTINNPGSALTDYQVRVDVTYDADMQPDFDDIRFVDSDDSTELAHWRESYIASTSAIFWVKVPSTPSGSKVIYMYYGNDAASSASDGDATFVFFDDFEDGDISDWSQYLSGTVQIADDGGNSVLLKTANNDPNGGYSQFSSLSDFEAVFRTKRINSNGGPMNRYGIEDGSFNGYGPRMTSFTSLISAIERRTGGVGTVIASNNTSVDAWDTWLTVKFRKSGNILEFELYDSTGSLIESISVSDSLYNSFDRFVVHGGWEFYTDDIRIRKYIQPAYSSPGTIDSQVLDTGINGDRWDALFWDETLPAGTDITFEVRASDTLSGGFPDTAWIPVGGTSPVTSGLPSGRYMQWRATLTTSDPSETPVLHEVRVYHY